MKHIHAIIFRQRILLLILCALALVTPSHLQAACTGQCVQEADFRDFGATSCSKAFASNTTTGNTVVGFVYWDDNTFTLNSVTMTGGTFTLYDNPTAAGTRRFATFAAPNITGNTTPTVNANFSGATNECRIVFHEVSGVASSSVDKHAINYQGSSGTGSDAITVGPVTTTGNGEYIFAATSAVFASGATAGTGFTEAGGSFQGDSEYKIQVSAGSITPTFTPAADDGFATGTVTLFASGGGGGGGKTCIKGGGILC